jgi:hypothetical protein
MPGASLTPKLWKDVFGAEPDQVARQPSMPSIEGGPKDGLRWLISHYLGRVDVVVSPENPSTMPTDLLSIGKLDPIIEPLLEAAQKAFDLTVAIHRLALGAVLFIPVETIRDGIKMVQTIVPQIQRLPENSTDLLFQLNVPIVVNDPIQELLVNRLAKWQVAGVQLLGMASGPAMPIQVTTTGLRPVVRLELDINTSPERGMPFPTDKLELLLKQLSELLKQIAKSGGFQ